MAATKKRTPAAAATSAKASGRSVRELLSILGPGLVTGASDDDPSGIGTYSQVGAQFGLGLLWTSLFTFPLMFSIQELCGRIALQTGVGLGVSLRRKFPTWLVGAAILVLLVANTINAGADLGAVAAGVALLTHDRVPALVLVVPIAAGLLALQLFAGYRTIERVFKWLTLALFAYIITGFISHPGLVAWVSNTFIPHFEFTPDYVTAIVAILGTTISPYLFFWQASAEVDELKAQGNARDAARRGVRYRELKHARVDILAGMLVSNVVMYFIILTAASVLHAHGKHDVGSAAAAAQALAPIAGPYAFVLFAIGIIGSGLLAVPVLTGSAAYAMKEFLRLPGDLDGKPRDYPTFYAIIVVATLAGVVMNFLHIDPIRALYISAVINGLAAPPLLVLIILLGIDRKVMGRHVSGRVSRALTGVTAVAMLLAALGMVLTFGK